MSFPDPSATSEPDIRTFDIAQTARWALEKGYRPVQVRPLSKRAVNTEWQERIYTPETLEADFGHNLANIGLQWGGSKSLIDIDMETNLIVSCAQRLLTPTPFEWGRPNKPNSHRIYKLTDVPEVPKTKRFKDPYGNLCLEMRGNKSQSVIPPSTHPTGERYSWSHEISDPLEITIESLESQIRDVVFASGFAAIWPNLSGTRHHAALAIIGILLKTNHSEDRTHEIIEAIVTLGNDPDPHDRLQMINPSARKYLDDGEPIAGTMMLEDATNKETAEWANKIIRNRVEHLSTAAFSLNDEGNARRFVKEYGKDFLYLFEKGKWLRWDGKIWSEDCKSSEIKNKAMTIQQIIEKEEPLVQGAMQIAELRRFALKSGNIDRINAILSLSSGILLKKEKEFDNDNLMLNTQNGILNLKTGDFSPHDSDQLHSKITNVSWNEDATCPLWESFLQKIFDNKTELISWIQKVCGYCLTGETKEQVMFFLYGEGKNGKSTFVNVMSYILGTYWTTATTESLMSKGKNKEGISTDIARLAGARFVSSNELEENRRWSEAMLKNLTGGDVITARFLYSDNFDFSPKLKLFTFGNNKPEVKDRIRRFLASDAPYSF